jgi:subtilisin family serine protease
MYYEFSLPPYTVTTSSRKKLRDRVDWSLRMLHIPGRVWKETKGAGIKVAILDTGYSNGHPDLQKAVSAYRDFTGDGIYDRSGHGTHVAGIVGARANKMGIVGVAPKCKLLIAKVLNNQGHGRTDWIVNGIKWAADQGADIISMSLGSNSPMRGIKRAINSLPKDTFVVAAAGNSGPRINTVNYPAKYDMVISVGAIDRKKKVTNWSSRGAAVDVVAPGDNIVSCFPRRAIASMSGTSMACPIVAGIMALALAKHRKHGGATPINNQQDMLDHLIKSCVDLGKKGKDTNYGYGLVSPNRLLKD